jgi:hypothetical protein
MTIDTNMQNSQASAPQGLPAVLSGRPAPTSMSVIGTIVSAAGLMSWFAWLSWRAAALNGGIANIAILGLELVAFAASLVVCAGLAVSRPPRRRDRRATDRDRQLPVLLAEALDLGEVIDEQPDVFRMGIDDTGEIAWARRGIRVLREQRRLGARTRLASDNLREAAWSVVALDGLRRLCSVIVLLFVLFTGATPFDMPSIERAALLVGGVGLVSIGNWFSSGGHLRPGARLVWSMASIGAGLGDGVSRSGLPIRWVMTMATLVALNIAVALRGMSDRWTHGLQPMERDTRIAAMSIAVGLVMVGGLALRRMPRPELGFYGATRRLEEDSVRRRALGLTLAVAAVGFVAGILPVEALNAAVVAP